MDSFRSFPEHARAAWKKLAFECQAKASIPEADLFLLQWQTLRDLANHLGITDPAECAKIELVWLSKQNTNKNSSSVPTTARGGGANSNSSTLVPPAAVRQSQQQNQNFNAIQQLRQNSATTPIRRTNSQMSSHSVSSSIHNNIRRSPAATAPIKNNNNNNPSHSRAVLANNNLRKKSPSASSNYTSSRYSTSSSSSSSTSSSLLRMMNRNVNDDNGDATPPRERQLLAAKVCIEDLKPVFAAFSSYGDDGQVDQIDLARFLFLCRSCDLMDKLFRLRDAEAIFGSVAYREGGRSNNASNKTAKTPVLFYHQFRMKVIPEIASKKQMSILELVKQIVRWGGPRFDKQSLKLAKGIPVGNNNNNNAAISNNNSNQSPSNNHTTRPPSSSPMRRRSASVNSNNHGTSGGGGGGGRAQSPHPNHLLNNNNSNNNSSHQFQPQNTARASSKTPTPRISSRANSTSNTSHDLVSISHFEEVPGTASAKETPRRSVNNY